MDKAAIHKRTLLLLVLLISALFLAMIHQFLMAIFLAGIFSALTMPIHRRFSIWFGGRRRLAAVACLMLIVFVILIPLTGLLGIVTAQAIKVGETAKPWVEQRIAEPGSLAKLVQSIPFIEKIDPYRRQIIAKSGELVGNVSSFLINRLSSITLGTVNFLFMLFVMVYAMYFFLLDGDALIHKMLYYLPLEDYDERRMLDKFTSVTRATLKGTAVIGVIQGVSAGAAFAVVGIPSAVFWGAIMTVLSIIPSIGSAIVWAPAAIILAVTGHMAKAIGLALFCALVVGSMDNLLRPILVGKDTQMHELMIFLATLGGIFMFGVLGIIIGPIIGALFVTVWDIYGTAFKDVLPSVNLPGGKNAL